MTRGDLYGLLVQKLEGASNKNILVVVRADASTSHGTVKEIINDARAADEQASGAP